MSVVQVVCTGCLKRVNKARGGLERHYQQSCDPRCIALYQRELDYAAAAVDAPTGGSRDSPDPNDFIDIDSNSESGDPPPAALESDEEDEPPAQWEPPPQEDPDLDMDVDPPPPEGGVPAPKHAVDERFVQKPHVTLFGGKAGAPLPRVEVPAYTKYTNTLAEVDDNPWAPFKSQIDWQIARWAKVRGSTSTAFSDLLAINGVTESLGLSYKNSKELNQIIDDQLPSGRPVFQRQEIVVGGEAFDVYFRPIIDCVRALYGDPEFAQDLIFAPERHYVDPDKTIRLYHDIHTAEWWWKTQKNLEKRRPGATIVPVIISTDKTQTTMFRNKAAYPVYMTIGNIPKDIRRKPSHQGYILIGYLPTTRLDHIQVAAARRRAVANLYHACMRKILSPLRDSGLAGIEMASGDGVVRRCHPLLAIFAGDYPEQVLAACVKTGKCPTCPAPRDELGNLLDAYEIRDLEAVSAALAKADGNTAEFTRACAEAGIKPIYRPFWEDLPYVNIYLSITPDILHQLYQGVIKHVFAWIKEAFGPVEIDAQCRCLPPNHNTRLFLKGITTLPDIRDRAQQSTARLVRAVRAALDFLYQAQYPMHSTETMQELSDDLQKFPSAYSVTLPTLTAQYGAIDFRDAFAYFVIGFKNPEFSKRQCELAADNFFLPFQSVSVYHNIKFWNKDPLGREDKSDALDVVHVKPGYVNKQGRVVGGRFDTAIVNDGTGKHSGVKGYRVGQVRVVFSLTERALKHLFPNERPHHHLAYVEWFSKFPSAPEPNHAMYKISRPAEHSATIIPVANIRRSVQLFPEFGPIAPRDWTSQNVLERCRKFYNPIPLQQILDDAESMAEELRKINTSGTTLETMVTGLQGTVTELQKSMARMEEERSTTTGMVATALEMMKEARDEIREIRQTEAPIGGTAQAREDGAAVAWANNIVQAMRKGDGTGAFKEAVIQDFKGGAQVKITQSKMESLRQEKTTATAYFTILDALNKTAGFDDTTLIHILKHGIQLLLVELVYKQEVMPKTYDDWKKAIIKHDGLKRAYQAMQYSLHDHSTHSPLSTNRTHNPAGNTSGSTGTPRRSEWCRNSGGNPSTTTSNPGSSAVASTSSTATVPMDIDRTTARGPSFRNGKPVCYHCNKEGHIARNCPEVMAKNPQFCAMMTDLLKETLGDFLDNQE
ncbi:hypothetical protein B0H17DRAFT_1214018 [Mycena rosella]|uniref:CCHC-type domain-containing protein n=1 Tax=Mycena rosella TaxID=1033263 RepID=A0AAD7CP08_MYCRO|nr:hypothetical protein B0H17DRAFT_1214018 [Mycena rosella]